MVLFLNFVMGGVTDVDELFVAIVLLMMSDWGELWEGGTIIGETPQATMWVSGNIFLGEVARLANEGPYLDLVLGKMTEMPRQICPLAKNKGQ